MYNIINNVITEDNNENIYSADIEGVNSINSWRNTANNPEYQPFKKQVDLSSTCLQWGTCCCKEIFVKMRMTAQNLDITMLPKQVVYRGWGSPAADGWFR